MKGYLPGDKLVWADEDYRGQWIEWFKDETGWMRRMLNVMMIYPRSLHYPCVGLRSARLAD